MAHIENLYRIGALEVLKIIKEENIGMKKQKLEYEARVKKEKCFFPDKLMGKSVML